MSRITPGTMIVAIFAVLFGLVGAYAVKRHLAGPAVAATVERTLRIPLASIDLPPDKPIRLGDIMLVPMTPAQMQERGLPLEVMANTQQIIGRILREPVLKGEPFVSTKMYPEGMGPSVAERLKPGLRAVTVAIKGTGALQGFASPGSHVDVLFRNFGDDKRDVPETTVTLVEDVEVLAFGTNAVPDVRNSGEQGTVTLAVSAVQANALKVVEGRGDFSLALRNPDDASLAGNSGPQTMEELLKLPRKQVLTTDIYRGGTRQTLTFDRGLLVQESFGGQPLAPDKPQTPVQAVSVPADGDAPAANP